MQTYLQKKSVERLSRWQKNTVLRMERSGRETMVMVKQILTTVGQRCLSLKCRTMRQGGYMNVCSKWQWQSTMSIGGLN